MPKSNPLSSSRPSAKNPSKPEAAPAELRNINARLWQDPLQAVEQYRNALRADRRFPTDAEFVKKEGEDSEARIAALQEYIAGPKDKKEKDKTLVLVCSLNSVTNAENVERRLRMRWAVLAALGRSGYVPREQIGYFLLRYEEGLNGPPVLPGAPLQEKCKIPIPYELIEPQFGKPDWCPEPQAKHVVLLWLPDDWLGTHPLDLLGQLGQKLNWGHLDTMVRVIGPSTSTTLTAFAEQVAYLKQDIKARHTTEHKASLLGRKILSGHAWLSGLRRQLLTVSKRESPEDAVKHYYEDAFKNMEMLASMPTISNALLRVFYEREPKPDPNPAISFRKGLADMGIKFNRTIASDDVVAGEMIHELGLRGIRICRQPGLDNQDKADDVAVIAEWDTPYGRCLPLTLSLMAMIANENPSIVGMLQELPDGSKFPETFHRLVTMVNRGPWDETKGVQKELFPLIPRNIHQFYYYKGIDGNVPSQDAGAKEKDREGAKAQDITSTSKGPVERASGENQTDYLRRLAAHLKEGDSELRNEGRHIRAVLVLGGDLYDKFLVMKAIRSVMPDALLMTNNLDADMASVDELGGNPNLVIVSPYGLSLSEYYQAGVPPFRDSYQTGTYTATLAATRFLNEELYPNPWNGSGEQTTFWTPQSRLFPLKYEQVAERRPRVFETGHNGFYDLSRDFGKGSQGFAAMKGVTKPDDLKLLATRMHPLRRGPDGWLGRLQQNNTHWNAWWVVWILFLSALVMLAVHLIETMYSFKRQEEENEQKNMAADRHKRQGPLVENGGKRSGGEREENTPKEPTTLDNFRVFLENLRPFKENLLAFMGRISVAIILVLLAVVVVPVLLFWFQAAGSQDGVEGGEPLSWIQGVSVWPTQGIRLAAWVVLLHLLCRTYASHTYTENAISDFLLGRREDHHSLVWWNRRQILLLLLALLPAAAICFDLQLSLHGRMHVTKLVCGILILIAAICLPPRTADPAEQKEARENVKDVMHPLLWGVLAAICGALLTLALFFNHQVFTPPVFSFGVVLASVLSYGIYYRKMTALLYPTITRKQRNTGQKPEIQPGVKWRQYLLLGCLPVRLPRILLLTNALFWLAVLLLECWPAPSCPARGNFAFLCDCTSFTACMLALSFISAVVVDAVLLNRVFTIALHMSRSLWPLKHPLLPGYLLHESLGRGINEYLDMRLLAFRSKPVANLIYCPFIVLGFVVASQNHLLDAYPLHPPITTIWVVNLGLGCFCAWLLQRETNEARKEALRLLDQERWLVSDKLDDKTREQKLGIFDRVMDEVRAINDGAFAPLWDQPFVRAIFFSSGSIGITSILSALSNWWK